MPAEPIRSVGGGKPSAPPPPPAGTESAATAAAPAAAGRARRVLRVLFISLVLDLLAFTIILPLFPRLLEYYRQREGGSQTTFLGRSLHQLAVVEKLLHSAGTNHPKLGTVLLGGVLGSLFSFLQFLSSPVIGRLSDSYGRRTILLVTMTGNIASALLWMYASGFAVFVMSRIVGGLSEGNVQLAIAIISDVTPAEERSKSLALVGLAFAIAFSTGPALGAYLASKDFTILFPAHESWGLTPFSFPAAVALALVAAETIYLYVFLEETAWGPGRASATAEPEQHKDGPETSVTSRLRNLRSLNWVHFLFIFIFSGMEFTFIFLTYDILDFTNAQQGTLLAYIGLLNAAFQGGYVRRRRGTGEKQLVTAGVASCATGLGLTAALALQSRPQLGVLYAAASFLAFSSATVVTGLTALASVQCDGGKSEKRLARGRVLGKFRSVGQLGRAAGPIAACVLYWWGNAALCYSVGTLAMCIVFLVCEKYVVGPSPTPEKAKTR